MRQGLDLAELSLRPKCSPFSLVHGSRKTHCDPEAHRSPRASGHLHDFDMHAAPREAQQGNFGDRPSEFARPMFARSWRRQIRSDTPMITSMLYGSPFLTCACSKRSSTGSRRAQLHREPVFRRSTSMLIRTGSSSRPNCPACNRTTWRYGSPRHGDFARRAPGSTRGRRGLPPPRAGPG